MGTETQTLGVGGLEEGPSLLEFKPLRSASLVCVANGTCVEEGWRRGHSLASRLVTSPPGSPALRATSASCRGSRGSTRATSRDAS